LKKHISLLLTAIMLCLAVISPFATAGAQEEIQESPCVFLKIIDNEINARLVNVDDTTRQKIRNNPDGYKLNLNSEITAAEWAKLCENKTPGDKIITLININAPVGAEKAAVKPIAGSEIKNEDIAYFDSSNASIWKPAYSNSSNRITNFEYAIGSISKTDGAETLTLTLNENETTFLVCWLDGNGNKIDLGMQQYIGCFSVKFNGNLKDSEDNPTNIVTFEPYKMEYDKATIPYERGEGNIFAYIDGLANIPSDRFSYELKDGILDVKLNLSKADWEKLYYDAKVGSEWLFMTADVMAPAKKFYSFTMSTGKIEDDRVANALMALDTSESWLYQNPVTYRSDDSLKTIAAIRRYGSTIMIEPVNDTFYVSYHWRDENGYPIDIDTSDEYTSYVEYLTVRITHESTELINISDDTTIDETDIIMNSGGWDEDKYYGKERVEPFKIMESTYENGEVVYFIDYDELKNLHSTNNGKLPDQYYAIQTKIKAPKDVVSVSCTRNGSGTRTDILDGYIKLNHFISDQNYNLYQGAASSTFEIVWTLDDNSEIVQRITITTNPVYNVTSMDLGGWTPVSNDRIIINPEHQGNTGLVVKKNKEGTAHLYNHFTGGKVEVIKDNDILVNIIPPTNDKNGNPINVTKFRVNISTGANAYIASERTAQQQRNILNENAIESFADENNKSIPFRAKIFATFTPHDIPVTKGNRTEIQTVYFPEIYGTSIRSGMFAVIDWLDDDGNVLAYEYFYHTNDQLKNVHKSGGSSRSIEATNYSLADSSDVLVIETFPQESNVTDGSMGAEYVHLSLEDQSGNAIQPEDEVIISVKYPEGTNGTDYDFMIEHYEDESHTKYEVISVEEFADHLEFKVKSFSPFMLSWAKVTTDDGNTGDGSTGDENTGNTPSYPEYDDDDFIPINPSVGCIPTPIVPAPVTPSEPEEVESTFSVLCNKLNIRAGAGTGFEKIGSLKRGASIKGELLENGWIKFTMENGEVGYVSGKYVYLMDGEDCMDCEGSATVVCSTLNVRSGPDTSFDKVGKIKRGDTVYIVSCDATHTWYKIIWNDAHAWISAKYVYTD